MVNQGMPAAVRDENVLKPGWKEPAISPIETEDVSLLPEPRSGSHCPDCLDGIIDYDGMLNLSCVLCGYSLAGCFT